MKSIYKDNFINVIVQNFNIIKVYDYYRYVTNIYQSLYLINNVSYYNVYNI